jgi:hypothetical protein
MEFRGHAITLSLVVARFIAIKNITTLKIKRQNRVIVYQETAIYGLLTRSAALVLISTLGIGGAIFIPIYASVAFAILFLALNS